MFKTILSIVIFAMIFSGCVGTDSPIGKGTISKPHK